VVLVVAAIINRIVELSVIARNPQNHGRVQGAVSGVWLFLGWPTLAVIARRRSRHGHHNPMTTAHQ